MVGGACSVWRQCSADRVVCMPCGVSALFAGKAMVYGCSVIRERYSRKHTVAIQRGTAGFALCRFKPVQRCLPCSVSSQYVGNVMVARCSGCFAMVLAYSVAFQGHSEAKQGKNGAVYSVGFGPL